MTKPFAAELPIGTDLDGNVVEFWTQDLAAYAAEARAGGRPGTFDRPS